MAHMIHHVNTPVKQIDENTFNLTTPGGALLCKTTHKFLYRNAVFSVGTVVGDPDGDTMFLAVEKEAKDEDEGEATIRLLRPDEMAVLAYLCGAAIADELASYAPNR